MTPKRIRSGYTKDREKLYGLPREDKTRAGDENWN